ncbi:hypothetical protein FLAG1_07515 [Fusarium langsethiae]|uniref:Uncharacterized protein n=1 Tax=Fusarium langsethiae TaxID=179993 RepID=A0A0N0DDF7_FUSLA|nr:hypothetical protein FLAG1_07515 [Fusarium langsethiae]
MPYQSVILGLVATVAAIDIRFYTYGHGACFEGPWIGFANVNPGVYCVPADNNANIFWATAGLHAIPKGWRILGRGYSNSRCKELQMQYARGKGNGADLCLPHNGHSLKSAKYNFIQDGQKRDVKDEECKDRAKASELGLGDGSVYDISNMSDEDVGNLNWLVSRQHANHYSVDLVMEGASVTEMPQLSTLRRLK